MKHVWQTFLASDLNLNTGTPGTLIGCRANIAQQLRAAMVMSKQSRRSP